MDLAGGILGDGFGVSVAPNGNVWFGNFGWGNPLHYPRPDGNGSVSEFSQQGKPISGPLGYQGGVDRAQGIAADPDGNIWICSFGNDCIVVFPKGDPSRPIIFPEPPGSAPFDIQIASDGTALVSNSGGLRPGSESSVARFALVDGQIQQLFSTKVGHGNKALSLDSKNQAWVASGGDSCVYLLDINGKVLGQFKEGFGAGVEACSVAIIISSILGTFVATAGKSTWTIFWTICPNRWEKGRILEDRPTSASARFYRAILNGRGGEI